MVEIDTLDFTKNRVAGNGYTAHELVKGSSTGNAWSLAVLEIHDSPRHVHTIERELFVVVQGMLAIEIGSSQSILQAGESITIQPGTIHKLKSARSEKSVSVVCISFPAFDPADMHCLE